MKKRHWGVSLTGAMILLVISASSFLAQRQRNRPAAAPPPMTNLKVTYKTTMGQGQSSESTTMIRGPRERSEMHLGPGMDIVSLTQCDLKRTVQFNDKARKYVVTPM